jgi:hypothetical protein
VEQSHSGPSRAFSGGGGLLKSLHSEAGGAALSWERRTGNGGQPRGGGCSNVGITYTARGCIAYLVLNLGQERNKKERGDYMTFGQKILK